MAKHKFRKRKISSALSDSERALIKSITALLLALRRVLRREGQFQNSELSRITNLYSKLLHDNILFADGLAAIEGRFKDKLRPDSELFSNATLGEDDEI